MLVVPYVREPAKDFKLTTLDDEEYDEEDLAQLALERQRVRDERARTRLAYLTRMQKKESGATDDSLGDDLDDSSSSSSSSSSESTLSAASLESDDHDRDDEPEETFDEMETPRAFNEVTAYMGKVMGEVKKHVEDGTLMGKFQKFRQEQAKARRHRGLKFFEMKYRKELEEEKKAREWEEIEKRWAFTYTRAVGEQKSKATDKLVSLRLSERQRFDNDMHKRDKRTKGLNWLLAETIHWDLEKQKRTEEAALAEEQQAMEEKKRQALAEMKRAEEAGLKRREEEVFQTQQMLSILRRAGGLPSVNPPVVGEPEAPLETDRVVTLRPRPGAVVTINTSQAQDESNRVSYFQVDLKRFRFVEVVKGEGFGPRGGVALAGDFKDNCGSRVHTLDLRSCKIRRLGMDALSQSFTTEVGKAIHTMNLRDNDLTGQTMVELGLALQRGALPLLRYLDLRGNLLQDHGACHLASFLFAKLFTSLEQLYLQRNDIHDQGALALYRVFEGGKRLCPTIREMNIQQNKITHLGFRLMPLCPPCFKM